MIKQNKLLALILACLTVLSLAVTAAATESKPYGSYDVTITSGLLQDTATAYVTKCSCNPVDNYLMAGIQIQYKEGNQYYWTPSSSSYYYKSGTNVDSAQKSISEGDITYAKAWIQARCGDGDTHSYYDTATK